MAHDDEARRSRATGRPSSWSTSSSTSSTGPAAGIFAEAMVKVRVDGEVLHTAAEGDGPVDALDAALRKALAPRYPQVERDAAHRLQGPHPRRRRTARARRPASSSTRSMRRPALEHRRRDHQHHRGELARARDAVEYGLTVAPEPARPPQGRRTVKASIVVLPGDGIGPEVTAEALRVLEGGGAEGRARAPLHRAAHGRLLHRRPRRRRSPHEVLTRLPGVRRGPARRGRRAEVGRPEGQGAAGAGAARPAQGARRLRQPAPGAGPPGARRRLAAQGRPAARRRHPRHPRADRRPLLRRAEGARPQGRPRARRRHARVRRLRGPARRRARLPAGEGPRARR